MTPDPSTDPSAPLLGRSIVEALGEFEPVGRDLLGVDWTSSGLGPPDGWSQSLKTMVRVLLSSRFSMWMAWGPRLTFFCNDAYRRDTLGAKYPWALGKAAKEVWAEIWPDIGPRIDKVLTTGQATWDEALLLFLERSGYVEETYHTFSYSPLTDDAGAISGMLCVVSEDTERVIAQRRMSILRDLGAASAADLHEVDVCRSAASVLEADGKEVPFGLLYLFDGAGVAHLAASAGVGVGGRCAPATIHPDDPTPLWPVADARAGTTAVVTDLHHRLDVVPRGRWPEPPSDATIVPLPSQTQAGTCGVLVAGLNPYRPFDDGYQSFLSLVASQVATQIAKARSFEAERRRAEQLAELDRAKTAFFTGVSHELRTPLTLILGPLDDLLEAQDGSPVVAQRDEVEIVRDNARRLLKLVNELLDFSRLESGRATGRFQPVDLALYTADLASMFRAAVERGGLRFVIDAPPLPEPVYVDPDHWSKIVLNLVSNALKFTFDGSITVRVRPVGHAAELAVIDTGVGIAPDDQARLFERFHRVEGIRARTHEGSGIGLALVAELTGLHGGSVRVESRPGEGSTFKVLVPFGSSHLPSDQLVAHPTRRGRDVAQEARDYVSEAVRWLGDSAEPDARGAEPPDGRALILVVDDNADLRHYLARLLRADYQVATAADGVEALAHARRRVPDLVLTDVTMPRLDGFGLLRELRADPTTQDVPVVMVSARAGEEGTVEGLEAGADDYLVKPFGARELRARVAANLELERNRRVRADLELAQRLAQVGSWEIDLADWSVRGSAEYFRIHDVEPSAVHGDGSRTLFSRVHPDDVERVHSAFAQARHNGGLDIELRLVVGDEIKLVRALGEFRPGPPGHPGFVHGSLQDVTAQRQTEVALAAVAAAKEAAEREHTIAEELQRSLLPEPRSAPEGLEVATFYRAGVAGTQVGGDWYDVIDLSSGLTALVLGDVMGRGVAAAALMGQLRSAMRAYAKLDLPPAEIIGLCDQIVADMGVDQLVTAIYAVYDPAIRKLTYANAGHLPPLVALPDGTVEQGGPADRPPLGAGGSLPIEHETTLPPGATLVLYTDGLIERRGGDLGAGIRRLSQLLRGPQRTVDELVERVVTELTGGMPDDDVALLVARVPFGGPLDTLVETVVPDVSGLSNLRSRVAARLDRWGVDPERAGDVVLVACELATNALVHGQPPAELRLRRSGARLVIEVHDHARVLPRLRHPDAFDEHGRGLQLVDALSQRWGTRPSRGGKWTWCEIELVQ